MSGQPDLFTHAPTFDSGVELTVADHRRLTGQLERVFAVMSDGKWHTVAGVRARIAYQHEVIEPETSISAQLRNLRKAKFGGHTVERRRVDTHYEYRLVLPACTACEGDGFAPNYADNCPRCGGGGKEPR